MENIHFRWTPANKPIERVKQGEEFRVIIPDSSTMQMRQEYTRNDMSKIDDSKFDGAVGPLFVEGAEPGDTLEVDISSIGTGEWGWTAILGNFGLLKGKFGEELIIWDLKDGYATPRGHVLEGIKVPLSPFLGVVGVAPSEGEFGMIPPQYFGGNMDNRLLKAGSRLFLPVHNTGALLSFSDPHGAQGDGEVCGTAVETSADIIVSVKVHKGKEIRFPRLFSTDPGIGNVMVAMGIGPDMNEATRNATLEMVDLLSEHGFTREEGYALCSVAGLLRLSEVVDEPHFVVSMVMPEELVLQRSGH